MGIKTENRIKRFEESQEEVYFENIDQKMEIKKIRIKRFEDLQEKNQLNVYQKRNKIEQTTKTFVKGGVNKQIQTNKQTSKQTIRLSKLLTHLSKLKDNFSHFIVQSAHVKFTFNMLILRLTHNKWR